MGTLVDHFYKECYGRSVENRQMLFTPKRLTDTKGAYGEVTLGERLALPSTTDRYHVYAIGRVSQKLLGINVKVFSFERSRWVNGSSLNTSGATVTVYNQCGALVDPACIWLMLTKNQGFILAVKETIITRWLRTLPVTLRIYNSTGAVTSSSSLPNLGGGQIAVLNDSDYASNLNRTVYKNGMLVIGLGKSHLKEDDALFSYTDDAFVYEKQFSLMSLSTFVSQVDSCRKYLVNLDYAEAMGALYHDDAEIWVLAKAKDGDYSYGAYLNKDSVKTLRMVTLTDFSVRAQSLDALIGEFIKTGLVETNMLSIKLLVKLRKNSTGNNLALEASKIHEARKLPMDLYQKVLNGVESNVPFWMASNLEASVFNRLMFENYSEVTLADTVVALGYDAMVKTFGESIHKVKEIEGIHYVPVPVLYQTNSTAFLYGHNGLLLRSTYLPSEEELRVDETIGYVEFLSGKGTVEQVTHWDTDIATSVPVDYTVYYNADTLSGDNFSKVDPDNVTLINGTITVRGMSTISATCWRDNDLWHLSEQTVQVTDGSLLVFIMDGGHINTVAYDKLDVFLNGYKLVDGLDYVVDGFKLAVQGKRYLVEGDNRLVLRGRSFNYNAVDEKGFVVHGAISDNATVRLYDDQNLTSYIGGRLFDIDDLVGSERSNNADVYNTLNGLPYEIAASYVATHPLTDGVIHTLQKEAITRTKQVSDFLTEKMPDKTIGEVSVIPDRHPIYSAFISEVVEDLLKDVIDDATIDGLITNEQVVNYLKLYSETEKLDYTLVAGSIDNRFVVIHPSYRIEKLAITAKQHSFLKRVISLYSENPIDTTHHVVLREA